MSKGAGKQGQEEGDEQSPGGEEPGSEGEQG